MKSRDLMNGITKPVSEEYRQVSLDFTEKVFAEFWDEKEGREVRALVEEIRSKKYYLPELDLMMTDENGEIIGYVMFSKFPLEGKHEDELLLLSPAAVKTELQRRHISKELIEYGFCLAKKMGFKAVLVEGNPMNYRSRGFRTSADFGIIADESVKLPAVSCLMVKELEGGALESIKGVVRYDMYDSLT